MARLKKSVGVQVSASNLPVTRSKSLASNIPAQDPTPATCSNEPRKRRYRPGSKALAEIRRYQRGTGLLIPKLPFQKVIKQISQELTGNSTMRFTAEAVECLQVAAEAMVIQLFEDSVLVMLNAKRLTLMVRDIQIVRRIRGCF